MNNVIKTKRKPQKPILVDYQEAANRKVKVQLNHENTADVKLKPL